MWFEQAGLTLLPAASHPELLAPAVAAVIGDWPSALVFAIDPAEADSEVLSVKLGWPLSRCSNAVLVGGRRQGQPRQACCLTLAHRRLDVNGLIRRRLDVRKASFLPTDQAVSASGMEHGGITPLGLDPDWPIWVDPAVTASDWVCLGSGLRASKLLLPGACLADLPGAEVVDGLAHD
ncbi:MAG: hypothetical protein LBK42_00490 [Propionibacteriaceae bacterium]|jgi:prolyl-tRNA editing enzyme YbaK/EbsC (Cys-tRNA(Pro) deacylase)|nr:hypothetical protein [Propionibacteriaceae bacterium]